MRRAFGACMVLAALAASAPAALRAQASPAAEVDRASRPPAGPDRAVRMPPVQRRTLSNGLSVWVVEKRGIPLVSLRLLLPAGVAVEPRERSGLASFTAELLDEGTRTRTGPEIADELEYLAATFTTTTTHDGTFLDLSTLARTLPAAVELFADMVARPGFPTRELDRSRQQRLTALLQAADEPVTVANQQLALHLYGVEHPYGRAPEGTAAAVSSFTREEVERFHRTYYRPNHGTLLVVGDVAADQLVPLLERAFAGWERAEVPTPRYPAVPAPPARARLLLIDKPGAAQSVIRIGHPAVPWNHPDYVPLVVLNTLLGGQFSSRVNLNLREDKGYTYGASTTFTPAREQGPFIASASVQTAVTKESVIEFMKELEGIRGARPITEEELAFTRASVIRREPLAMETQAQLIARLQQIVLYGAPLDFYDGYVERLAAVTRAELDRVAREHLHPDRFTIVVVGDRAQVESGLRTLPYPLEIVRVENAALAPEPLSYDVRKRICRARSGVEA